MTKIVEDEERCDEPRTIEVEIDGERRTITDRRRRPTPMFSRYMLWGGRRRHVRRDYEREGSFVDIHGPGVLFVVLAIVALNISGFSLVRCRISDGSNKKRLLRAIQRTRSHMALRTILRAIGLSRARYHEWIPANARTLPTDSASPEGTLVETMRACYRAFGMTLPVYG